MFSSIQRRKVGRLMLVSECCGAGPNEFFDLCFDFPNNPIGICGDCKDHAEFMGEEDEEDD